MGNSLRNRQLSSKQNTEILRNLFEEDDIDIQMSTENQLRKYGGSQSQHRLNREENS